MSSISEIGKTAVQSGFKQVSESAQDLVSAFSTNNTDDAVTSIIRLNQGKRLAEAGFAIIKVDDSLSKSLLDIFA